MDPFSTPGLIVLDTVRVMLTVAGFLLVGYYLLTRWPTTRNRHEKARAVGLALALFVLASSRITALGSSEVAWQLPASAVVFALVGYSALRGREFRR